MCVVGVARIIITLCVTVPATGDDVIWPFLPVDLYKTLSVPFFVTT